MGKFVETLKKSMGEILGWIVFLSVVGACGFVIFKACAKAAKMMSSQAVQASDLVGVSMQLLPAVLILCITFFVGSKFLLRKSGDD